MRLWRYGDALTPLKRLPAGSAKPACSIESCAAAAHTLGMCKPHYDRKHRQGDGPEAKVIAKKGDGHLNAKGYHQVAGVLVHRAVAEEALGKPLPAIAVVHHINGVRNDNCPENLVVCPDDAYHMLLHARERAYDACGHADWLKCRYCKAWAPSAELSGRENHRHHPECKNAYNRAWRAAKKEPQPWPIP